MEWIACLASSWDGKITAAHSEEKWIKLGSEQDLKHLFHLRGEVQALLFGASTLRAWPSVRFAFKEALQLPKPPIHVILTQSWQLPWGKGLFAQWQTNWPPLLIASPKPPPKNEPLLTQLLEEGLLRWLPLSAENALHHSKQQCLQIEKALAQQGVKTLLVEGGGEILAFCLEAGVLNQLYLTLTPWLIGGKQTPSLVGGLGAPLGLGQAGYKLSNVTLKQLADELYLHASIQYEATH